MDRRSNTATRRATVIANAEAAATDRLIQAIDQALGRLWNRYSTAELRELAASLAMGLPTAIVNRFDADLTHVFGGEE